MGMNFLGSSSSADRKSASIFSKTTGRVVTEIRYETLPNPKPDNYKIIRSQSFGKALVIEIQYLDCTNYEGRKILVFNNCSMENLLKQKLIDPHFSENKHFISPTARFEPTEKGWYLARVFATDILNDPDKV